MWSTSPLVRKTPAMGDWRPSPRGCSRGEAMICWRKSGDALRSSQDSPSAPTATLDWVRAATRGSPAQASRHTGHRQFHCGNPPPAAEPRTRARRPCSASLFAAISDFGRLVARDFHADANFDDDRGRPGHALSSTRPPAGEQASTIKLASSCAPGQRRQGRDSSRARDSCPTTNRCGRPSKPSSFRHAGSAKCGRAYG
jgi:hypothetical protein